MPTPTGLLKAGDRLMHTNDLFGRRVFMVIERTSSTAPYSVWIRQQPTQPIKGFRSDNLRNRGTEARLLLETGQLPGNWRLYDTDTGKAIPKPGDPVEQEPVTPLPARPGDELRDGRFGRPRRIHNSTRDKLFEILEHGDDQAMVEELVSVINREENMLAKSLDELEQRLKHVRTAIHLGRSLNDLGEFQGHTYEADGAIIRREVAYRTLAAIFNNDVMTKLRKGEPL